MTSKGKGGKGSGGSERMRRLRDRQRRGVIVAPTPLSYAGVHTLIDLRWLRIEDSEDRQAIGHALGAMLDDLARSRE